MKKSNWMGLLLFAALVGSALACGQGKRSESGGGLPIVRFLSPPAGTQVAVGNQVYLQARAFARGGVGRVDFTVNGAPVGSQRFEGSQRLVTVAQAWAPTAAGAYTLVATAYDAAGKASTPAQVTITAQQGFSWSGVAPGAGSSGQAPSSGGQAGSAPSGGEAGGEASGGEVGGEISGGEAGGEISGGEAGGEISGGEAGGEISGGEAGGSTEPVVDFRADDTQVQAGQSTTLRWNVDNAREVYLDGQGVTGHGTREVVPFPPNQTYILHVVLLSGEGRDYAVTIEVTGEYQLVGGPDLVVLAVDCPDTRDADETVPFQVEVLNAGDAAATGAQWRWSVNRAGDGPATWQGGSAFNLEPGQTTILRDTAQPQPAGRWTVYVEVSLDGEANTENNQGSDNFTVTGSQGGGPDLAVGEMWCSRTQMVGQEIPCRFNVRNEGGAQAQGAAWSWTIVAEGQSPGANQPINGTFDLPAGQSTTLEVNVPGRIAGDWTFYVHVTLAGEQNTANNEGSYTFPVGEQPVVGGPDLAIGEVWCSRSQSAGQDIPCRFEISNVGDARAQDAQWMWAVTPADSGSGRTWSSGGRFDLDAGQTIVQDHTLTGLGAGEWTFYVDMALDGEWNNGNNDGSVSFTVGAPAVNEPAFAVTLASVSINPTSFSGSCPHTAQFSGVIKANGPGTVKYRWVRNGQEGSTKSVTVDAAGAGTVTGDWELGTSGTYRMGLHVVEPNDMTSNEASFSLTCSGPPATPANLRISGRSKAKINLRWDNVPREDYFEISMGVPGACSPGTLVGQPGQNATEFSVSGLSCGTDLCFRIRACNTSGCSDWSDTVSGSTTACN